MKRPPVKNPNKKNKHQTAREKKDQKSYRMADWSSRCDSFKFFVVPCDS
jgi:hypothetical protein